MFDFEKYLEGVTGEDQPIPVGERITVRVDSAEVVKTKAGDDQLVLGLVVVGGEWEGKKLRYRRLLTHHNPEVVRMSKRLLKQWIDAARLEPRRTLASGYLVSVKVTKHDTYGDRVSEELGDPQPVEGAGRPQLISEDEIPF